MEDYQGTSTGQQIDDTVTKIQNLEQSAGQSTSKIMSQKSVTDSLNTKVDKVDGKGLSTNDYTDSEKNKVELISANGTGNAYLANDGAYKEIPTVNIEQETGTSTTSVMSQKAVTDSLNTKVDKVVGKGLSTNDYTDSEKNKVELISANGTGNAYLANDGAYKEIPTVNVEQETGTSTTSVMSQKAVTDSLNIKVDKVDGKGLSTNDYTDSDKSKVELISATGSGNAYLANDGVYKEIPTVNVEQETGTSTTSVMSQKATTDAVNNIFVPTKTSDLTNDSNFITQNNISVDNATIEKSASNSSLKLKNVTQNNTVATRTLAFGDTFSVPTQSINNYGQSTGKNTMTYTLPQAPESSGIKGIKVNSVEIVPDSSSKVNLIPATSDTYANTTIPLSNFRQGIPNNSILGKIVFPETINITAATEQSYYFVAGSSSAYLRVTPSVNSIALSYPAGNFTIYNGSSFANDYSMSFYGFSWASSSRTLYIYPFPGSWVKSSTSTQDTEVLSPDATVTYSVLTSGNSGIITSSQHYKLSQKPISCEEISPYGPSVVFTNKYFENQYPIYGFNWSSSGGRGPYTDQTSTIGNTTESKRVRALISCSGYWKTGTGITRPIPYYGANGDYLYCEVNETTHQIVMHKKLSLTSTEDESYRIGVEFILI